MKSETKTHLTDPTMERGIRCNNPRAGGPATLVRENVTCGACKQEMRRTERYRRDNPDRVPPGPAGGD